TAEFKTTEAERALSQAKAAVISQSEADRMKMEARVAMTQIEVAKAEVVRAEAVLAAARHRARVAPPMAAAPPVEVLPSPRAPGGPDAGHGDATVVVKQAVEVPMMFDA